MSFGIELCLLREEEGEKVNLIQDIYSMVGQGLFR